MILYKVVLRSINYRKMFVLKLLQLKCIVVFCRGFEEKLLFCKYEFAAMETYYLQTH